MYNLQALSMGVHESQSLLWERMVGLSMPFARYLTPLLQASFPQLPSELSPERVYGAVNVVKFPSMIRVEADEVQYPLHILLRRAPLLVCADCLHICISAPLGLTSTRFLQWSFCICIGLSVFAVPWCLQLSTHKGV